MKKNIEPTPETFRADCRISLVITSRGGAAKHGIGVEILDASERASVKYKKFLGRIPYPEALVEGILGALEQALRMHKEKPELLIEDARTAGIISNFLPGEKQLKGGLETVKIKAKEFQKFRARQGTSSELEGARALAEAAFERN